MTEDTKHSWGTSPWEDFFWEMDFRFALGQFLRAHGGAVRVLADCWRRCTDAERARLRRDYPELAEV